MSAGPYNVILADPPWYYQNRGTRASADKHYATMTLPEIKALPVADLAAMPSALFLWATWPNMPAAMEVIEAWGFEYKTLAWIWLKTDMAGKKLIFGLGNYTRSNSEPCLLAFKKVVTRGRIMRVTDKSVPAYIVSPRLKHSQKPMEQYEKIGKLYPGTRKLELFARIGKGIEWDVWGDEVEGSIEWKPLTTS